MVSVDSIFTRRSRLYDKYILYNLEGGMDSIPVGISACLTGQPVRHDGGHKRSRYCTDVLSEYFELLPFCPEREAGLAVPRPAMHLVEQGGEHRLTIIRTGEDVTPALQRWCQRSVADMGLLRGFVLASKSPSCGMERVRVYNDDGNVLHRDGSGLFARYLQERWPMLPVEEDGRLLDPALRENFIERVFLYDDWCRFNEKGLTAHGLIRFHTRHKFQLLAHCQKTYRQLGPLLADLSRVPLEELAEEYIAAFMRGMRRRISRGAHVNVMLHLLGYFRGKLDALERGSIQDSIHAYLAGEVPLVVPMTLLRHAQRRFPDHYLSNQAYLVPYPDALGLRNQL